MKDNEEITDEECCIERVVINDGVINEWKKTFEEYNQLLKPNRKSIDEILEYIKLKYPVEEDTSAKAREVVEKCTM